MSVQHVTVQGTESLIREIAAFDFGQDIKVGRPSPADGFVDSADAPLGPEEIRQIIEIVNITITTGTAAVVLLEKLKTLVARAKSVIELKDARTGEKLATLDESSDLAAIASKLKDRQP
jgi:hypothetical protein